MKTHSLKRTHSVRPNSPARRRHMAAGARPIRCKSLLGLNACRASAAEAAERLPDASRPRSGTRCSRRRSRDGARQAADRRFAAPTGPRTRRRLHRADVPAERAHADADGRERRGRREDQARIRFAVQQWVDAAGAEQLPRRSTPRRSARRSRPRAKASRTACSTCWTTCSRAMCRRPTRACSRSAATSPPPKARWCSRTSCSSCIEYKPLTGEGARAADAVRAAVHQQVLHPRPAARELADPLHGRAGPPGLRGELAQRRRRRSRHDLGRLHRGRRRSRRSSVVQEITRQRDRSTRWASASAAPSSPPRWRCWPRAASSRPRA